MTPADTDVGESTRRHIRRLMSLVTTAVMNTAGHMVGQRTSGLISVSVSVGYWDSQRQWRPDSGVHCVSENY